MKNRKDISSLKGLRINGWSYLLQTFCPYRDRQEELYQKAFLTAKFAKKSQGSQRGNYLFIKTLPIRYVIFKLREPSSGLFDTLCRFCRKNGVGGSTVGSLQISIFGEGSPEPDCISDFSDTVYLTLFT